MSLDAATVKGQAEGQWLFILEALAPALHAAEWRERRA